MIVSFLKPSLWFGIHHALKKQIPDSDFIYTSISSWLKQVLITYLVITAACYNSLAPTSPFEKRLCSSATRAAIVTALAPLTLSQTIQVLPHIEIITNRLSLWQALRQDPEPDAIEAIESAKSHGLISRNKSCDIFFPEINRDSDRVKAMLIIPGFCVSHESYAAIASKLAKENGIIVAIQNLEPFRVADEYFLELKQIKNVMRTVQKELRRRDETSTIDEWCFSGHSLGGYCVMRLAPHLASLLKKNASNKLKIMVWGAGDKTEFLTDIKNFNNIKVSILLAKDDTYCNMEDARKCLSSKLPEHSFDIIDGNHENFASYSSSISKTSRSEQHEQIVTKTCGFILEREND
ncbi:hypothetical protein CTEN210_17415 [Chaetoceros tenuissimus]|uniref:Alpha/beta hydrolase fold-5 domain-containing protein n=1 Tax=Chaetoceros tenuissimus TaxID=426638 RepID=A0AAD3DAN1_9STRA|nr:hypothetical protein CTEN210_17415 [Chaetoceros tenuissimus]